MLFRRPSWKACSKHCLDWHAMQQLAPLSSRAPDVPSVPAVMSDGQGSIERWPRQEAVDHLRGRMGVSAVSPHEISKPTIAMVNGPAAGAGMSLALACDLRIAGQSARFVTAFANMGFSGDFGGSYFLSKLVGTGKARELYYTAEPLDAAQALALGVVNRVVPDADLIDATRAARPKAGARPAHRARPDEAKFQRSGKQNSR